MRLGAYLALIVALATMLGAPATPQTIKHSLPAELDARLTPFLQKQLCNGSADDQDLQYEAALVPLRDAKPDDVVVFARGAGWCGTGGCTVLVYATRGDSFERIARLVIAHPPIRLFSTTTHSWRDLGARICGGGILKCYDGVFKFNGTDIYLHDWDRAPRPDLKSAITIFDHDGDKPLCRRPPAR